MQTFSSFGINTSHTNYLQCLKVGRFHVIYGRLLLTSAVSAWTGEVFSLKNSADRPWNHNAYINIVNNSESNAYFEVIFTSGRVQSSKTLANGTELKVQGFWFSQG